MPDVMTPEQRSSCMSHIRSKNTKPEILVRKALFRRGFRYRINVSGLPGKPDIVLPKYRTVIFVNGCFWHGHSGCRYFVLPKTNSTFWEQKIRSNQQRDKDDKVILESMGWQVLTIWGCQLKKDCFERTVSDIVCHLQKAQPDANFKTMH